MRFLTYREAWPALDLMDRREAITSKLEAVGTAFRELLARLHAAEGDRVMCLRLRVRSTTSEK